ncbi:endonuclease MutS2 [Halothermothrix orenii]|uniref:Endonuclease MutS2 n=1 Tax=Halothermothrix orenii (strain H 168 / OCM 544 / DSM 9562) TaxID=373903 RepID=MUTS2_HALOH|nr:endonuclease MutS2 [Halothermothrix orenii]B8D298.1 RecName: Full=Endonuclease MutS2 [Halothermothrix orenii H 168]ACL69325.1 MutS2 family protein [Halothermothrix orenii H 168]
MEESSLEILEFDKIIDRVQEFAATIIGKEIISRLQPVDNLNYVKNKLREVSSAREILEEYGRPPFGGIRDLREIIEKADKGIVLSVKEVMDVRSTLEGVRELKKYSREIGTGIDDELQDIYSIITEKFDRLTPLKQLENEINRCIDEHGEIKDSASRKLRSIRREMDRIEGKINDKLNSIINNTRYQEMLQDKLVTIRGNRYVVPVKSSYKNTFSGIVHDQSTSGLTYFMEPMAIVKLNNRLGELKRAEEQEIYRILKKLSENIKEHTRDLSDNLEMVSLLDVDFARARFSIEIEGIEPGINDKGFINIRGGRHPLLKVKPVPIDITVGNEFKTLVITGPNTGGKTVALKTVGLFVLMVQAGLHIPAEEETVISIFNGVYADIGDEQSIEQNLSTFSSHINRIKRFLGKADARSLVLLDEIGVGTDPREGAALGVAILEHLRERGVTTIATTHYSEIKSYAYSQDGVENASVEFDMETLQPTYRLLMGIPGGSNAFEIALKLGLPHDIIKDGKELMSGDDIKVENIISDLNEERKKYEQLKIEIEERLEAVKKKEQKYDSLLTDLEKRKKKLITEAREEALQIIKKTRKESKEILRRLKNKEFASRSDIDRVENEINLNLKETEKEISEKRQNKDGRTRVKEISCGDQVRLKKTGQKGEVISVDREKGEAVIQAGIMKVTTGLDEVAKIDIPDDTKDELFHSYQVKKKSRVSPTLDLRGERYETAQHKLDKYLDDVFLAGLKQVEIIHGKGTGALRKAVHTVLEKNPHITSYRLGRQEEGGSGVTIADLKS